jgi:cytidyltransferase-like protein
MSETIVCASGYMDPLHIGHIEYLEKSKMLGDKLIVIVNSDKQSQLKKGKSFMPEDERLKIVRSIQCVDAAVIAFDDDMSVCKTLKHIHPDIFTNGGDQTNDIIPEKNICKEIGIKLVDGLGKKIQSSSLLLSKAKKI